MQMVGRGNRTRPGGRSARVRKDVLAATLDVLTERGWAGVTIEEIAARARVHKTTIYRRWPNISELVLDAVLVSAAEEISVPDTGDARQDIALLLDAVHRNLTAGPGRALLAATIHLDSAPEIDDLHRRFWAQRIDGASEILRRGAERGEIILNADPETIIELLVSPLFFRTLVTKEKYTPAVRDAIVNVVLGRVGGGGQA